MSDPIDIKTKKIIPKSQAESFDRSLVLENLHNNLLSHYDTWGSFQQSWTNQAYKTFKDFQDIFYWYVICYICFKENVCFCGTERKLLS